MLDGTVFHGYLQRIIGNPSPFWISSPRILNSRGVRNRYLAYVRMSDGFGLTASLHEEKVLHHSGHSTPLIAVFSIIQLRNGTSSRAVLRFLDTDNNAPVQFSTSGTSVFVGFPEGLVFTGMFEDVY